VLQLHSALLLFLMSLGMFAQELAYSGNPDISFFAARDLAFNDNRSMARDTLKRILTVYPDYADVRELLAKTYSWDGEHDKARAEFNKITSVERENKEVWVAAIKNEIYAENYPTALGLANKALLYVKKDEDIEFLRQRALNALQEKYGKGKDLSEALVKDPLELTNSKNRVRIDNSFDIFDIIYEPAIYTSVEYRRETKAGYIIPRLNYNNRFETHGIQYGIDFYPKFSKTFYGYLNYAYSDAPIFPDHRVRVEMYANLPKALESSAGIIYLDFVDSSAEVYTGSFGMYRGNDYYSLRTYVAPQPNGNTGVSGLFKARRYLKDADTYVGINIAMGYTPELKQLSANNILLSESLLFIESQLLQFEYQFSGKNTNNIYGATLGLTRQELVFDPGRFFWAVSAGINYQVKF
ncbi:MAG: YaiO family outer membrane beta-barrel protein, partial [Bacteroidota bacterium]